MGDYFVLNGQKVWTSGAQFADWIFLLARTDPDAPKHKGISYLLLDMKTKGVDVRPLVTDERPSPFQRSLFRGRAASRSRIWSARKNEGWKVAMTTLMHERGVAGGGGHSSQVQAAGGAGATIVEIDGRPAWENRWVRQRLAQFAIECKASEVHAAARL